MSVECAEEVVYLGIVRPSGIQRRRLGHCGVRPGNGGEFVDVPLFGTGRVLRDENRASMDFLGMSTSIASFDVGIGAFFLGNWA